MKTILSFLVLMLSGVVASAQLGSLRLLRLALVSTTNSNSVQFIAGSSAAQQAVALPPTLPSVGNALKATTISGSDVTTAWANTNSSGGSGSGAGVVISANAVSNIGASYADLLVSSLSANTAYVISGRLRLKIGNNAPSLDVQWVLPAGATVVTTIVNATTGVTYTAVPATITLPGANNAEFDVVITGLVTMGSTAGNVQFQGRKNGTSNLDMLVGSFLSYVP